MLLKRLKKNKSLRIVNLLGLSVIFASLVLSYAYIKKEWSYDRFHGKSGRIVRMSEQFGNEPIDGRLYGFTKNHPLITHTPGIEDAVLLSQINTGLLKCGGKSRVLNNFYFATSNFFQVFDFKLLEGGQASVLDAPGKVAISERLARELFGEASPLGKEIQLSGRRFEDRTVFVSGVFEDFPEASHFHTDLIANRPDNEEGNWTYVYLLLHENTGLQQLHSALAAQLEALKRDQGRATAPFLAPLTDIHLRSHLQRELEPNGNINYLYIVAGANALLLAIVLFNLWLNAGLIFAHNRRFYQLLRLNGASSQAVLKDEALLSFLLGAASILLGGGLVYVLHPYLHIGLGCMNGMEASIFCLAFLALAMFVSLLPVASKMPSTLFLNSGSDLRPARFSLSNVRFMLVAQYGMVMFIVIVSFVINKQIHLIKVSQVGGQEKTILAMKEQPTPVQEKYELLKAGLLKHPGIEAVTSAMQLPGTSIRDGIFTWKEGETAEEGQHIPLLAVGNDFLPFFRIQGKAGEGFPYLPRTLSEEQGHYFKYHSDPSYKSNETDNVVINLKAAQLLDYKTPEEAIGKSLFFERTGGVLYTDRARIIGVTEDFNYTTTYEETLPLLIFQRKMFQHCILVRLSPGNTQQALAAFNQVWEEVNPGYPASYTFLQDVYAEVYHNELNAESLVYIFSLLSLVVSNLGLIIIMAFVIKRKTKEISIRKVNGATTIDIIRLLNNRIIAWIGCAFAIAVPLAYLSMTQWLGNFAQKARMEWWIFALAGATVLLISTLSVSWQSWRASRLNPVKGLNSD